MWVGANASRFTQNSGASTDVTHPNIILITLDTTRADRMGFLGSKRGLTPNLDAMAQHGVVFHARLLTSSHHHCVAHHDSHGDLSAVQSQ